MFNVHTADIPKTIARAWHMESGLKLMVSRGRRTGNQRPALRTTEVAESPIQLTDDLYKKWIRAIAKKEGSKGQLPRLDIQPNKAVLSLRSFQIKNKNYTSQKYENGNSIVNFWIGKNEWFGVIDSIFQSDQFRGKTWVVVYPWKEILPEDEKKDPYAGYPELNCRLVRCEKEMGVVLNIDRIIGHAACMKNWEGTFAIPYATYAMVGLGGLVSLLN